MKMKLIFYLVLSLIVFPGLLVAQDSLREYDLREYYHPLPKKGKSVTKVYRNISDPSSKVKWVFQASTGKMLVDGKKAKVKLLTISVFDSKGQLVEETVNRVEKERVILEKFKFFVYDSLAVQSYDCTVADSIAFIFSQKIHDKASWRINFTERKTGNDVSFRKVSEFKGWIEPKQSMKWVDKYFYDVADIKDRRDQVTDLYFKKGKGLVEYHTVDRKATSRLWVLEE